MEITWLGRTCFRLRGRDGIIITDPVPPDSGYKVGKQQAHIITVSRRDDPGYSATAALGSDAMVLDAPGEYEIAGMLVHGVVTNSLGSDRNVAFVMEIDGIRIGHLGLITAAPSARVLEELGEINILLFPVGGFNAIAPAIAQDLMTAIDPAIAIPMNFRTEQETLELEPLDKFLKETGGKNEPQPKLTVTRNQLPSDLTVVVLEPKS